MVAIEQIDYISYARTLKFSSRLLSGSKKEQFGNIDLTN